MKLKISNKYLYIEETVIVILFLCVLSVKARMFLSNYMMCILFITFHELAHVVTATIFKYNLIGINIRLAGLNAIFNEKFNGCKGIIVYLAGPVSNIILALLFNNIKFVYEINIALAIINMFPLYPLDGFNVLKIILDRFVNKTKKEKYMKIIQKTMRIFLIILATFMCIIYQNFSLFLMLVYIKTKSL